MQFRIVKKKWNASKYPKEKWVNQLLLKQWNILKPFKMFSQSNIYHEKYLQYIKWSKTLNITYNICIIRLYGSISISREMFLVIAE